MPQISARQVARVQGAILAAKSSLETLIEDEEIVSEFTKGLVVGAFAGVPQKLKAALETLEEVLHSETEEVESDQSEESDEEEDSEPEATAPSAT